MLATRGMSALFRGVPEGGIVWGSNDFLKRTSAFALGVLLLCTVRDPHRLPLSQGFYRTIVCSFMLCVYGVCVCVDYGYATAYTGAGFFLFEVRDSLNMYLAYGVLDETLIIHHSLGVVLYVVSLTTKA